MLFTDRTNITSQRRYTDEGFLVVPAKIARTGIMLYTAKELGRKDLPPETAIRVYRDESEVFKPESMKSFENKSVTNGHPPVLVSADNYKLYNVGVCSSEVTRNGIYLETELTISDSETIRKVEKGKAEISNGYIAGIEWKEGVTADGENYDCRQINIIGNHIAIVEKGRAGSQCKLADNKTGVKQMIITIDGVDYEVTEQTAQAINKLKTQLSDAVEEKEKTDEEIEKMKKEKEDKENEDNEKEKEDKSKMDALTSKIPTTDQIDKLVEERSTLVSSVKALDSEFETKGKSNDEIKKNFVIAHCDGLDENVSQDYINGRFDTLLSTLQSSSKSLDKAFQTVVNTDSPTGSKDNRPAHVIAREKMMSDARNAWQKK